MMATCRKSAVEETWNLIPVKIRSAAMRTLAILVPIANINLSSFSPSAYQRNTTKDSSPIQARFNRFIYNNMRHKQNNWRYYWLWTRLPAIIHPQLICHKFEHIKTTKNVWHCLNGQPALHPSLYSHLVDFDNNSKMKKNNTRQTNERDINVSLGINGVKERSACLIISGKIRCRVFDKYKKNCWEKCYCFLEIYDSTRNPTMF